MGFTAAARWSGFRMGLAAALVCAGASRLNAQQVRVTHQAGMYLPTRISIQNGSLNLRQSIGFKVGTRITLAFSRRFDVATGITYIPGYATLRGAGKRFDVAAVSQVLAVSIGARYWLVPPIRSFSWELHTGLGMVSGGQRTYENLMSDGTFSATLGTMLRYEVGRIVALRLKIQQRLYRFQFGGGDPGSSKPLRFSMGLEFPFLAAAQAAAQ